MNEIKSFEGGMNLDSDERTVGKNQYRYALNIRLNNAQNTSVGVISNSTGNREVSYVLPNGANLCIGAIDDINEKRTYYVVANSLGDNRILAYDYIQEEIVLVFGDEKNVLGLSIDRLITAINVVQGDEDDFLIFTDDFSEPKLININAGLRRFKEGFAITSASEYQGGWNGSITYQAGQIVRARFGEATDDSNLYYYRAKVNTNTVPYLAVNPLLPLTGISPAPSANWEFAPEGYLYDVSGNPALFEYFVTLIVKPPENAPVCSYSWDSNLKTNAIKGSFYQFKYKYVLADGRESSWSPVSEKFIPLEVADSTLLRENDVVNNVIDVSCRRPDLGLIYKDIVISARRVNDDLSPDDWYIIKRIKVNDATYVDSTGGNVVYKFTNNEQKTPIDQSEANQLFSWIPKKVRAISTTSENRVILSNFKEGYDFDLNEKKGLNDTVYAPTITSFEANREVTTQLVYKELNNGVLYDLGTDSTTLGVLPIYIGVNSNQENNLITITIGAQRRNIDVGNWGTVKRLKTVQVLAGATASQTIDNIVNAFNNSFFEGMTASGGKLDIYMVESSKETVSGTEYAAIKLNVNQNFGSSYNFTDTQGYTWQIRFNLLSAMSTPAPSFSPTDWALPKAILSASPFSFPSLKKGSQQHFAIAYSDKYGRMSNAVTNDSFIYNVPFKLNPQYIEIELKHEAPEWAVRWHLLKRRKNGIRRFVQLPLSKQVRATNIIDNKFFERGVYSKFSATIQTSGVDPNKEMIYASLSSLNNIAKGAYNDIKESIITYQYTKGDRIRLISYNDLSGVYKSYDDAFPFDASISFFDEVKGIIGFYVKDINPIYTNSVITNDDRIFDSANKTGTLWGDANVDFNVLLEIYTPENIVENDLYYEVTHGKVINKIHRDKNGLAVNIPINTTIPSTTGGTIVRYEGDVYIKPRIYPYVVTTTAEASATYVVEDYSFYDVVACRSEQLGRPNRVEVPRTTGELNTGSIKEVDRLCTIRYTLPYNPETGFNGIGTALDTSFIDVSQNHGSVQKLHSDGQRVFFYQENKIGFMYAGQNVILGLDGVANLAQSDMPLSKPQYFTQDYGISRDPYSFAFSGNTKYFADINRGVICRQSDNGTFPISDYGMRGYIQKLSRKMLLSNNARVLGFFDEATESYYVNFNYEEHVTAECDLSVERTGFNFFFPFPNNWTGTIRAVGSWVVNQEGIWGDGVVNGFVIEPTANGFLINESAFGFGDGIVLPTEGTLEVTLTLYFQETLSFNEKYNAWESFHSLQSDFMSSAGITMVSFNQGKLYVHDSVTANRFYGIDFPSYVDLVSNDNPQTLKVWKTLNLSTDLDYSITANGIGYIVPISVPFSQTFVTDETMLSGVNMSTGDWSACTPFAYKEGNIDTAYMRATNAPENGFIEGRSVRGYWNITRIAITANKLVRLFTARFGYIPSMHTS